MSGLLPALGGGGGGSGGLSGLLTTNAAVQVTAGGLSGLVAMTAAIATGVVPVGAGTSGPSTLAVVTCPGSASVVAVANAGERMLVTAKSADGGWLRVYIPGPVAHDGWVRTGLVDLLADGSKLPVAACSGVGGTTGTPGASATAGVAVVNPTLAPTATASPTAKPTTKPTTPPTATPKPPPPTFGSTPPPPPTLAPTPTPNVGPVFASGPTSSVPTMFADPSGEGDCWGLPRRTTIKVVVADPDGVAGVELWVKKPGATAFAQLTHNFSNHTSYWSTFIDAYYDHIYAGGTMSFYAVAIDGKGLKTKSTTGSVQVRQCDTDATVTWFIDLPQDSDGTYLMQGNCVRGPVPWYFKIKDPDGTVSTAVLSLTKTNYYSTIQQTVDLHRGLIYWYGESTTLDSLTTNAWVLTATDINGGTTVVSGSVKISSICIK
jgi:hypothetical protein